MSFHPSRIFSESLPRRSYSQLTFSFPRLVRLVLVALLLAGFVLEAESGIARAATRMLPSAASTSSSTLQRGRNGASATTNSQLSSTFVLPHVATPTNP